MKLTDIIELAKQGYKPNEIKELIELSNETEANQRNTSPDEGNAQKTPENDQEQVAPEGAGTEDPKAQDADAAPDYRSLYEAEKEKNSTLQKMLKKVDISGSDEINDVDIFADAVKNFM